MKKVLTFSVKKWFSRTFCSPDIGILAPIDGYMELNITICSCLFGYYYNVINEYNDKVKLYIFVVQRGNIL